MTGSLRRRLVRRVSVAVLCLLLIGTLAALLGVRQVSTRQFDAVQLSRLATIASRFEQEGNRIELDFDERYVPAYSGAEPLAYYQVWVKDGSAGSVALGDAQLPRVVGTMDAPAVHDLRLPDGRSGRAVGARVRIADYEPTDDADPGAFEVDVVVAADRAELDALLFGWLVGTGVGSLILLALGARLVRSSVDRGLAPVGDLVAHVEAVRDPTDATALDPSRVPDELRPVAEGLNRLVDRIGRMLARERRTSANIAHELRTPLAELLMLADVSLRYGEGDGDARRALAQVHEVGLQMRRLIGILLQLARIEAGELELDSEPIELGAVLSECWQTIRGAAEARGTRHESGGSGLVAGDREGLAILVGNLLSNAVEHAPEGSTVSSTIRHSGTTLELCIENPAPDLERTDLVHLTEPFWRAEGARGERSHAGLGLALAERLAALMQSELSFELVDGTFRARLRFPATARAASA